MTTSDQINEIAAALAKAQGQMKNATLNKVNPHFRSKYADLAGIRDAVVPALSAHGIAVVQTLGVTLDDKHYVDTRLIHASGQWIECSCQIPQAPDMQKMGSAITYARRYSLSAICGIAADEDDDGHVAASFRPEATSAARAGTTRDAPSTAASAGTAFAREQRVDQEYDAWLLDLEAVTAEGRAAFDRAWAASRQEHQSRLTQTAPKTLATLRTKASKVKEAS